MSIQPQAKWGMWPALILFVIAVFRVPVADGYFRPLFRLVVETGVLFLFAIFIYQYINKWFGLFLALVLFSTIYPVFGKWSYMARGAVLTGCIWYVVIILTITKTNIGHLLNTICIVALVNVIFANFQNCGIDPYGIFTFGLIKGSVSHPTGLMANKNLLSGLLAISLPAFFRPRWMWFVPIIFIGLTIASSTSGALAVTIMVLVYFGLKDGRAALRKNFFKASMVLMWFIIFLGFFDIPVSTEMVNMQDNISTEKVMVSNSLNDRTEAWSHGLRLYAQAPIFGYGIGHWKLIFRELTPAGQPCMVQAHNEFIQGLFEMGIFFPLILFGYCYEVVRKYKKEAILPVTALGIIIINSCFSFPFHVATTAIIAITWLAILEIKKGD